ncbi:MAG: hypothetical protein KBE04_01480 [Phycisphaerae bacterium]|nr:hypothetical protein [Phycisphaerae bacterium]
MAKCPHCKKPVTLSEKAGSLPESKAVRRDVLGTVKKEIMYSCPHCDSVLGFGLFIGGMLTGRP